MCTWWKKLECFYQFYKKRKKKQHKTRDDHHHYFPQSSGPMLTAGFPRCPFCCLFNLVATFSWNSTPRSRAFDPHRLLTGRIPYRLFFPCYAEEASLETHIERVHPGIVYGTSSKKKLITHIRKTPK